MDGGGGAGPWSEHLAPDGKQYFYNKLTGESTWERPAELMAPPAAAAPSHMMPQQAVPEYAAAAGYGHPTYAPYASQPYHQGPYPEYGMYQPIVGPGPPIQKTKNSQGPPGCNLFIFHIPNDMTNRDLYNYFAPFGNVISARIMVDRETGRSRGFGFVSYDTHEAAEAAIQAMDGCPIGKKRLKVAHKKEKGTYDHSRRDRREDRRDHSGGADVGGHGGMMPVEGGAPGSGMPGSAAPATVDSVVEATGNLSLGEGEGSGSAAAAPAAAEGSAAAAVPSNDAAAASSSAPASDAAPAAAAPATSAPPS